MIKMTVFVYQVILVRSRGANVGMRINVCVWQGKYRGTLCTQNDKTLLSRKILVCNREQKIILTVSEVIVFDFSVLYNKNLRQVRMMAYVGYESGTTGIARITGKRKRKTRIAITPSTGRVCRVNKKPNKNSRI